LLQHNFQKTSMLYIRFVFKKFKIYQKNCACEVNYFTLTIIELIYDIAREVNLTIVGVKIRHDHKYLLTYLLTYVALQPIFG
jgi:hypothetical protein